MGRAAHGIIAVVFLLSTFGGYFPQAQASVLSYMPEPSQMVSMTEYFNAPLLRGIKVDSADPFKVDFIIDEGSAQYTEGRLNSEIKRLFKYFLASVTIPPEDLWVNLSPYERDSIAPDALGLTEMGKDLLGQDYCLKQLASSLTYPDSTLGKKFWDKVYRRARELYGKADIPISTFNKVWIVPGKIVLYEDAARVFIKSARLKVMIEEDYLAIKKDRDIPAVKNNKLSDAEAKQVSNFSAQVMKEVVIPAIEEEVNNGKSFAYLRQVYNAMLLAVWFKDKLRATILGPAYVDQRRVKGIESADAQIKEKIYQQYLEAVRQGVYNYKRADFDPLRHRSVMRRYYSGGFSGTTVVSDLAGAAREEYSEPAVTRALQGTGVEAGTHLFGIGPANRVVDLGKSAPSSEPASKFVFGRDVLPAGSRVAFMDITRGSLRNILFGRPATNKAFDFVRTTVIRELQNAFGDQLVWPEGFPDSGVDEVKFAVKPVPGTKEVNDVYYRQKIARVFSRLRAGFLEWHRVSAVSTAEEDKVFTELSVAPLFIPEGSYLAKKDVVDEVSYKGYMHEAEMRQQVAKARTLGAYSRLDVGPETQIARAESTQHLIDDVTRAQMVSRRLTAAQDVAARLGSQFAVEGIGPCIAADTLNGHEAAQDEFWDKLVTDARKQQKPGVFVVRRAPDTFYILRTFGWDSLTGEAQIQILQVSAFYNADERTATGQSFQNIKINSGRLEAGRPSDIRVFSGFKGPNDTFGHNFGTELIKLELENILENIPANDREMTSREIILALEKALVKIDAQTTAEGKEFSVYFEPGVISTRDMPASANGAIIVEKLEDLHRARHAVQVRRHLPTDDDPDATRLEVSDAVSRRPRVMLKDFRDNSDGQGGLARNVIEESERAQRMIRERVAKDVSLDSKRLAVSLMMKKIIGTRYGFDRPFDYYLSREEELLRILTGEPLAPGLLQQIGQAGGISSGDASKFNDLDTIVALTQMAVMMHRVREISGDNVQSAADFVEKTHNITGFITEPAISRGAVSPEAQALYAHNRDLMQATAFLAQVLQDGAVNAVTEALTSGIKDEKLLADIKLAAHHVLSVLRTSVMPQVERRTGQESLALAGRHLMGKKIQVAEIKGDNLEITDSKGVVTQAPLTWIDVDIEAVFEALSDAQSGDRKNIEALAFLKEALVAGDLPDFSSFDALVEDALGKGENAIALYKELADNPVAILHEVLEYLQAQGRITLAFNEQAGELLITNNITGASKILKLSGDKGKFKLTGETALDLAQKGAASDADHYNARALARQILGEDDEGASLQITAILDRAAARAEQKKPTTTGGIDLGAASGQIEKIATVLDIHGREVAFDMKELQGVALRLGKVTIIKSQK